MASLLTKLMEHSGRKFIQQVTREDALSWRSSELERCQASTVRTRLRFLNGLFAVAEEEGLVQSNPFHDLPNPLRQRMPIPDNWPLENVAPDDRSEYQYFD